VDDRRTAFEMLFARHHTAVLRYVERRVDDREQARELTMDCFEIAWRRFDPALPFRLPWLLQTARNIIGDSYRRRSRERAGFPDLVAAARTAAANHNVTFDHVELELALHRLRPADREVLELVYWDGLSAAEVADVLGCRTPAAWKKISRAREALRALLEEPALPGGRKVEGATSTPHLPTTREGMVVPHVVER
jgi:RNA polymerase sigma factor (sigma-70 family)